MPGSSNSLPTEEPASALCKTMSETRDERYTPKPFGSVQTRKVSPDEIGAVIGNIPYRMALAGGWIDQPFVSKLNPTLPAPWWLSPLSRLFASWTAVRMGTSTRKVAMRLWGGALPPETSAQLVRELYD